MPPEAEAAPRVLRRKELSSPRCASKAESWPRQLLISFMSAGSAEGAALSMSRHMTLPDPSQMAFKGDERKMRAIGKSSV
jgi:hypothetical protein